ncbi:PorT family protein [Mucilaginibacter sp. 14171R-50]|uniref:type IX secretion/gliding motility protein PorT/SprT n=1 Tax=Mucilaginibacter sp. 14171R-50 TaxID=2703789 RepID=UPI00138D5B6C|nr:outer membrane beta-barrel protein [Mucilaginibacter sp. 14171R-50]QHS56089.1 PorT family protein [Mucilaginibacter sp. 14171R-50]
MIKARLFITIILMGCSKLLFAQAWGGGADSKDLSFGFSFSYIQSSFKIIKQPYWRDAFFDTGLNQYATSKLTGISSKPMPGFAVGFLTRYRITDHLETRITPSLVFADRAVSYTYEQPEQDVTKPVQTTTVDFPLQLKLKSDRIGNFRAYLLGGLKYSGAIGSKKNDVNTAPTELLLRNIKGYSSYEAGVGFDIYFEYFKLSPEIKLSNSFGNILLSENTPYANPISRLSLHTFTFSLHFE